MKFCFKNTLYFRILIFILPLIFFSCEKEASLEEESVKELHQHDITDRGIVFKTYDDFKGERAFQKGITVVEDFGKTSKGFSDKQNEFEIHQEKVAKITTGSKTSYTMPISRKYSTPGIFENLVMEIDTTGTVDAFILSYSYEGQDILSGDSHTPVLYQPDLVSFERIDPKRFTSREICLIITYKLCNYQYVHAAEPGCTQTYNATIEDCYTIPSGTSSGPGTGGGGETFPDDDLPLGGGGTGGPGGGGTGTTPIVHFDDEYVAEVENFDEKKPISNVLKGWFLDTENYAKGTEILTLLKEDMFSEHGLLASDITGRTEYALKANGPYDTAYLNVINPASTQIDFSTPPISGIWTSELTKRYARFKQENPTWSETKAHWKAVKETLDVLEIYKGIVIDSSVPSCMENMIIEMLLSNFPYSETTSTTDLIEEVFQGLSSANVEGVPFITIYKVETLPQDKNGETKVKYNHATQQYEATVKISQNLVNNGTKLALAKTVFHESIHAYLKYIGYQYPSSYNDPDGDFSTMVSAWHDHNNLSYAHHVFMGELVQDMAANIGNFMHNKYGYPSPTSTGTTLAHYEATAWSGIALLPDPSGSQPYLENPLWVALYPELNDRMDMARIIDTENGVKTYPGITKLIDNNCN